MKNKILPFLLVLMALTSFTKVEAQGWIQDNNSMYSLGFGGTQVLFQPARYYSLGARGSVGLALNIAGEYKVHRLIGIGWQTGLNLFTSGYYYDHADGTYANAAVIGIPIGFKFNFHILEATQAPIKNRLDVYAGFNVGGGPAFYLGPTSGIYGFIYGGPQVGVRYWLDKIAVFGELGWGATFANIGITFR
jgi:hypothetical protein